ncbi:MAG: molybdopterin molybdenumtransferase MoeA [Proteobacteria bacterium]|nr:MAG: molybdopterin molybdenumtransferase MoeA [Pseudomonadota bacterium]
MIRVEEAEKLVHALLPWGQVAKVPLAQAAGLALAEPLLADREYPPFHRAMMDGIAVSWESFQAGQREFSLQGTLAAGDPETALADPKTAVEIMTGACVPRNADLVIQYEHLKISNGLAIITEERPRPRFENVHLRGSDCEAGAEIVPAGVMLNGPRIGIAASFGFDRVSVRKNPRILLVSTGDELVPVESKPLDHQIRLSNGHALRASLLMHGFSQVDLAHLHDEEASLRAHFEKARAEYDVLIYSGAVSMGKFDYLPKLWREAGVEKIFHGVAQRPGKPLWFGHDKMNQTLVIGLPGNPISSLVCLHRYFLSSSPAFAVLEEEIQFDKPLTYFLPVKVSSRPDGILSAASLAVKNSGEFAGLSASDGFLELPANLSVFPKGQAFRYFAWGPR